MRGLLIVLAVLVGIILSLSVGGSVYIALTSNPSLEYLTSLIQINASIATIFICLLILIELKT